jgi:hypothetical protein
MDSEDNKVSGLFRRIHCRNLPQFCAMTALHYGVFLIRSAGQVWIFRLLIVITEIAWFVDFITFLYGIYKFHLR